MSKNPVGAILLLAVLAGFAAAIWADSQLMPGYKARFTALEKERVAVSNRLTTAKIVQENLNHVRDLIFYNMDLPGESDTLDHETVLFDFITTCVNDLKLKLVSMRPLAPKAAGRITSYGYDIELEGDFFRFGELCAKFENNRRVVSVESFDVELITLSDSDLERRRRMLGAAGQSANKDVRVKMRINTYRVSKG